MPVLQLKKTAIGWTLGVVVALVVLYALAGFVLAPRLIRSALLEDIPKSISVTPAVGAIHINPFLLTISVEDFSLTGVDHEKLLGFKRLFVDFELSSIWHRAYSFANIDVAAPYVGAAVAKDGTLNLLQLQPKSAPAKPQTTSKPLPAVRIGSFKVSQGEVDYEDRSLPDLFTARLEPINFELRDFTTGVEGGKFTFTGSSKLGERIEWHGHLSVQPIESDGEFRIDGLLVHTLWEYLQDRVNFAVNTGSIDVAGTYKFTASTAAGEGGSSPAGPGNLHVDVAKVALSNLTVRPKNSDTDWISLPSLSVTDTAVDLAGRHAQVDRVSLSGLKVTAWLEPDGSVNLLKLAAQPPVAEPGIAATPAAPKLTASAPVSPATPWTYDVRQFEVRDANLSVEDRSVHPEVKVQLAAFNLQVTGASQDLAKPLGVTLETRINERGTLSIGGSATPQPMTADLTLKLADLDLALLQPYIAQHSSMTLLTGALGADAKVHYGSQPKMPALQFSGDIDLEKLHTVDDALHDDFINWERLEIHGVNYAQTPDHLDIEQITVSKPYARVILEPDESLNVKRVISPPGGAVTAQPAALASPAEPRKRTSPTATTAVNPPATQMPMSIKKIVIQSGQANFSDLSVKPLFSAGIQQLSGSVSGISSNPKSRAKVDLHGEVAQFAPVSITGEVNVLGPLYTDLTMSFRNISLPIFNPYSGKFAGYNISKGKLTTELHYKVDGRTLDAEHHIIVDQLEFGDKTASKEAVSLPIKLAVSLLKDKNGVIDLNLPVTGSLDDPKFRLAPVIWKVFVTLLEKAIAAPFELLGSLFGGGPDIQFIDFQPGLGTLDPAASAKASTVAKALAERPQLKIEVPIAAVADVDGPALVAARYQAELAALPGSGRKKGDAAAAARPFEQLDSASQLELLTRLYAKDLGSEPNYPQAVTGVKGKPELVAAKLDFLSTSIRERIQVGDAELKVLGQQRALALQQILLTDTQIDPERVFLVANDKATAKDGLVRLELTLQ